MIKTLDDLDLKDARVLVRVDYNTPMAGGAVSDDARIQASRPTLDRLLEANCAITLMSHLGRPKGSFDAALSMKPVAVCLGEILNRPVRVMDLDGTPPKPGELALLENLRFWPGEKANDTEFAAKLARFGDIYINDAFGAAHRAHASIDAVAGMFETKAAGMLLMREVTYLREELRNPDRPFVAIMGGAKVSDKIQLIRNMLKTIDALVIGGAMSYTFLKAKGMRVGLSRTEDDYLDEARALIQACASNGIALHLPLDHVVGAKFSEDTETAITIDDQIPDDRMGLDIGPETINLFATVVREAGTVVWNGPMGVFEWDVFSTGTVSIAEAMADAAALTIVGGGDSAAAIKKAGVQDQIDHISTGGGAALELLSGAELPGIQALEVPA